MKMGTLERKWEPLRIAIPTQRKVTVQFNCNRQLLKMCLGNAHLGEKLVYVLKVLEGTRMCGMREQVKKIIYLSSFCKWRFGAEYL